LPKNEKDKLNYIERCLVSMCANKAITVPKKPIDSPATHSSGLQQKEPE